MIDAIVVNENMQGFSPMTDPELEEMLKAGVHLGHAKSKNHPAMQPYIFGVRNTISIIDLAQTKEKLAVALEFIRTVSARGGKILFVGTRPAARAIVLETARKTDMPYFVERWIGGTLTNFRVIAKRVEYMESLERGKVSGEFLKYTKFEQMKKDEETERLKKNFDGLRTLKKLPDAVFVVDITSDDTAVREARRMKIPIVALVDSNANADLANFPIPSNDDALPAVRYMVGRIGEAIEEGFTIARKSQGVEPQEPKSEIKNQ